MEQRSSRLWAGLLICAGLVAFTAATADWFFGWQLTLTQSLRRGDLPSPITIRALTLLRWWLAIVGVGCVAMPVLRNTRIPELLVELADSSRYSFLLLLALSAGQLSWTLPLGFVGDDFLWLDTWRRIGFGVLQPEPGSPHYIPLGLVLTNTLHAIFGVSALPYRVATILLHALTGWCVTRGARAAGLQGVPALAAGAMFLTTTLAYEPLLWATGHFYLWPGVMVASTLALVLRERGEWRVWMLVTMGLFSAVSGFVIEQAAGLTLFFFLWLLLYGWRVLPKSAVLSLATLVLFGGISLIALRGSSSTPGEALQSASGVARNVTHIVTAVLLPNAAAGHMLGGWIGASPIALTSAVLTAFGVTVVVSLRSNMTIRTLMLAWWCLWLPALLFAQPTSRYWFLPSIPLVLLAALGIAALHDRLQSPQATHPSMSLLVLPGCWIAIGLLSMGLRVGDWREADRIARGIESAGVALLIENPSTSSLVVADVPDGVGTDLWPAYVFNNGLKEALHFALVDSGNERWPGSVRMLAGAHRPWPSAYTKVAPADPSRELEIACVTSGTLGAVYDSHRGGLTPIECLLTE